MNFLKFTLLIIILPQLLLSQATYLINNNRLQLPINNSGVIGDVASFNPTGGFLDNKRFLFSAGFFLSGKNANTIWSNGVASTYRISDYQPGNVDSNKFDPRYVVYEIKSYPAFNRTWQNYRFAVERGAKFYDGDRNGIYNPVDLNGNGLWDLNEDRPDIIGNLTTWCVYNDGVPINDRRFMDTSPLGIEIHQTLFTYSNLNQLDPRSTTFFVRYRIINTGKVSNIFDSVYFGAWADTDIGNYLDDKAGCDTLFNAGYIYNDGEDDEWGSNPPAHFITLLQGPYAYIPGETFIDNNSNGEFDLGIDTPLDTAYNRKGPILGADILPGAKNLGMTSYFITFGVMPNEFLPPFNSIEARNYLLGKHKNGYFIRPCSWHFETVVGGVDCNQVNPVYLFSGDPIAYVGWLNVTPLDYKQFVNTGPFKLKVGNPVDIIVAHTVARGTSALNSIQVGKTFSNELHQLYRLNFPSVDEDYNLTIKDYKLYQNYPNPFNPVTVIEYQLPKNDHVVIKVYDILGKEVRTLVNEYKKAGSYKVIFDGTELTSGIYIYQMSSGGFIERKKMVLLR